VTFDPTLAEATLRRLGAAVDRLAGLVDVTPVGPLRVLGRGVLAELDLALRCAAAPVRLYLVADGWNDVRGQVTSVAGMLTPSRLGVASWQGPAAEAYRRTIPAHAAAAARVGTMAERTQTALTWSAAAGCAFYAGLLVVVVQFAIAYEGVLAALGTVALSWVGVQLALGELALTAAEIGVLVGLLVAAITTQAIQLNNLSGEAADQSAFPGGHWPPSTMD
jgi:hypothetical protein